MTQGSEPQITDEMRAAIGVESDPETIEIDRTVVRRVADALGDPNPLWQDEEYAKATSHGGIVAFPIALHPSPRHARPRVQYRSPFSGGAVAGDEWEFREPIRPGDTITMVSKIVDFTEREGRDRKMLLTTTETTYTNQHGRVAMIARRTNLSFGPRRG